MKKTYIIPNTSVRAIAPSKMLAASGVSTGSTLGNSYNNEDVSYVKEQRPESYNVWDDDWSK